MALLFFILVIAGHAELVVAATNRIESLPLSRRVLRLNRHLHDALITLFPLLLLGRVGIGGPGLLFGGRLSAVPLGWKLWFIVCMFGAGGLLYSALRWRFHRPPRQQIASNSRIFDIAECLGHRPVGPGKYRLLTCLPKNELFRLEFVEKVFELPRLPRDCDGLSILHLSDTHFFGTLDRPWFEEVMRLAQATKPDLIVFTGDLLDAPQYADWLPATFGRLSAPLGCYFILGNHDLHYGDETIRPRFTSCGWTDLTGRAVPIETGNSTVALAGTEEPWIRGFPDFETIPGHAFRILLSHTPDNLAWARRHQVDLMLSGHNHGGQIVLPLIGPVYSPSRHGVKYASGVFWRDPTLLSVSKGLSGRHPVRYGAKPEIVRMTLRCRDEGARSGSREA